MYKFPLESLRKYRKRKEELYQKKLYDCDQELLRAHEQLHILNDKRDQNTKKARQSISTPFTPSNRLLFEYYFKTLNQKIVEQNKKFKIKKVKKENATEHLLEAVKNRKMIEKLKEYQQAEYQKKEIKRQQLESDESAVLRFGKPDDIIKESDI